MGSGDESANPRKRRKLSPRTAAPYVLQQLLDKVPLITEETGPDVHITCVEFWNDNLYIGTSVAEILHFVALPADPSDATNDKTFILASRLPIAGSQNAPSIAQPRGIQQILLLPRVNKACILCNGVVTFYTLPELSPAFGNTKVPNCKWIGGLDLNQRIDDPTAEKPVIMVALQSRIMLVRIGDDARRVRNIEFPGCLVASRRDTIACVADGYSYSLLDVEHQQKIPLFPISSSSEVFQSGQVEDIPARQYPPPQRSGTPSGNAPGHGRSDSLNAPLDNLGGRQPSPGRSGAGTPDPFMATNTSGGSASQDRKSPSPTKDLPSPPTEETQGATADKQKPLPPPPKVPSATLKPHIASPTPSEFLLVTGTEASEPGVGMFVNMDGDVVRGTMDFHKYPEAVAVDSTLHNVEEQPRSSTEEGFVLAVVEVDEDGKARKRVEVQRWDIDPGEGERQKSWVEIPATENGPVPPVGIRHTMSFSELGLRDVEELLRMVRLKTPPSRLSAPPADPRTQESIEQLQKEKELFESQELNDPDGSKKGQSGSQRSWETERNVEEAKFARGLGVTRSSLIMWSGDQIWRVLRNPLTVQLDGNLEAARLSADNEEIAIDRESIKRSTDSIQDAEPRTEAEFIGFNYIRQKASLLLFADLISMDPGVRDESVIRSTEEALVNGGIDPRIILLMIPLLRTEVLQGPQGIWVHRGLAAIAESHIQVSESGQGARPKSLDSAAIDMIKRYLLSWQRKRGYGSITDEDFVFDSVDAALLHLLLEQDSQLIKRGVPSVNVRAELNKLVDNWKGNFDRAVELLEAYNRLFVLSRLYQSRKMSKNVLKSWRRIVEGEKDLGGEVTPEGVQIHMRKYLVKIRDTQLVEEYGSWLASRHPALGIQVFADDSGRVKLEPAEVVALLKKQAPNAVQVYLEHLVFSKNLTHYADDLIAYYLDTVISVLDSSPEARESLTESYATYRALRPPKPSYLNFITENAPSEPWWQSRLRLLQLLGGGFGTRYTAMPAPSNLSYSIPTVLARIEPYQNELVSESIILDGRQGRHREALRLLTHGLGDYDSAIRYCLFGGPSSTTSASAPVELPKVSDQSELFKHLLSEFLQIQDPSDRIERTSDLLSRFGSWFDVGEVLALVPDDWSVDILSGFLTHVFRDMVSHSREARLQRALSASLNLQVSVAYIEGSEKVGGWIEDDEGLRAFKGGTNPVSREIDDGQSDFGDMVSAARDATGQ
ncbi:TGF beta receptor associated protein 1, putative [Paecilomyces variotii No. 5]|uniref:TGF beta receptor associated protein 1, putative n=1 Tax=Byssochlamys spectabilis (strain No. 5 / NBRC 109023) TaxID=1356009 RepID=V5G8B4_BYSSN|nr:TGF beta receptor associated protein 1, putative [Paecilomyces variotii No. 5]